MTEKRNKGQFAKGNTPWNRGMHSPKKPEPKKTPYQIFMQKKALNQNRNKQGDFIKETESTKPAEKYQPASSSEHDEEPVFNEEPIFEEVPEFYETSPFILEQSEEEPVFDEERHERLRREYDEFLNRTEERAREQSRPEEVTEVIDESPREPASNNLRIVRRPTTQSRQESVREPSRPTQNRPEPAREPSRPAPTNVIPRRPTGNVDSGDIGVEKVKAYMDVISGKDRPNNLSIPKIASIIKKSALDTYSQNTDREGKASEDYTTTAENIYQSMINFINSESVWGNIDSIPSEKGKKEHKRRSREVLGIKLEEFKEEFKGAVDWDDLSSTYIRPATKRLSDRLTENETIDLVENEEMLLSNTVKDYLANRGREAGMDYIREDKIVTLTDVMEHIRSVLNQEAHREGVEKALGYREAA